MRARVLLPVLAVLSLVACQAPPPRPQPAPPPAPHRPRPPRIPAPTWGPTGPPPVSRPQPEPGPAVGATEEDLEGLGRELEGVRNGIRERHAMTSGTWFENNLSEEDERAIGLAVATRTASGRLLDAPEAQAYVSMIGTLLVAVSHRPALPYRFALLDDGDANAFACPGGYVLVTRGALTHCRDEAELAGVIAHEIAHVALKHGVRQLDDAGVRIARTAALSAMDEAIARHLGPDDPATRALIEDLDLVAEAHHRICVSGRSREFELEADQWAVRYASKAGWDPGGLLRFLEGLGSSGAPALGPAWQSHPPVSERIQALRAVIQRERLLGQVRAPERLAATRATLPR